jgi:hypothetical protein
MSRSKIPQSDDSLSSPPSPSSPDVLERIALQMASSLDLHVVLTTITQGLVDELDAAFARIWLSGQSNLCADCYKAADYTNRARCLHLEASPGLYGVDFVGKTVTPVRVVDKYNHTPTFRCYLGDSSTVQVLEAMQRGRRSAPHRIGIGILRVLTTQPVNADGIAVLTLSAVAD